MTDMNPATGPDGPEHHDMLIVAGQTSSINARRIAGTRMKGNLFPCG